MDLHERSAPDPSMQRKGSAPGSALIGRLSSRPASLPSPMRIIIEHHVREGHSDYCGYLSCASKLSFLIGFRVHLRSNLHSRSYARCPRVLFQSSPCQNISQANRTSPAWGLADSLARFCPVRLFDRSPLCRTLIHCRALPEFAAGVCVGASFSSVVHDSGGGGQQPRGNQRRSRNDPTSATRPGSCTPRDPSAAETAEPRRSRRRARSAWRRATIAGRP